MMLFINIGGEVNQWSRVGNVYFKLFKESLDQEGAKARCEGLGGNLAAKALRYPTAVQ